MCELCTVLHKWNRYANTYELDWISCVSYVQSYITGTDMQIHMNWTGYHVWVMDSLTWLEQICKYIWIGLDIMCELCTILHNWNRYANTYELDWISCVSYVQSYITGTDMQIHMNWTGYHVWVMDSLTWLEQICKYIWIGLDIMCELCTILHNWNRYANTYELDWISCVSYVQSYITGTDMQIHMNWTGYHVWVMDSLTWLEQICKYIWIGLDIMCELCTILHNWNRYANTYELDWISCVSYVQSYISDIILVNISLNMWWC